MSTWGQKRIVDGVTLVPFVSLENDTDRINGVVIEVISLEAQDLSIAGATLHRVRNEWIGRRYKEWRDLAGLCK